MTWVTPLAEEPPVDPPVVLEPVTARYWRLAVNEGGGQGLTISISELTLYDATLTAIPKAGAVVTALANWGGNETPDKAYDGNAGTWWAGRTDGQPSWLQVDHGAPISVGGFGIILRNEANTMPGTVQLQYSHDGVTWLNYSGVLRVRGGSPVPVAGVEYRWGYNQRIWRITLNTTFHLSRSGLQNIEFRSQPGVPEIPSGGRAFATGQWTNSETAEQAFDGRPDTNWGVGAVPSYVGYIFPTKKVVREVMLQARVTDFSHAPSSFVVEYSDDLQQTWVRAGRFGEYPEFTPGEKRLYAVTS